MDHVDAGSYPITIRIKNGILLVQCGDLGITVSRNFDLVRGAQDIGNLYFDVFKRVCDEISRRKVDGKALPTPTIGKFGKILEPFDITISTASRLTGIPEHQIRRMSKEELPCIKTPKGHRRYRLVDLVKITPGYLD